MGAVCEYSADHFTRGQWGEYIIAFHHAAPPQMLLEQIDLH